MSNTHKIANAPEEKPLLSFGVISDVQYADIPDGHSFLGTPRYYQHSLLVLQRAVHVWNDQNLKFVVNFGDIVDGKSPKDQSLSSIKKIVNEFNNFNGPVYHIIGNHCLYNLAREKLLPLLNISNRHNNAYYDFSPIPEYRFIVLDGYDVSAMGWPKDHPHTLSALEFLKERNPNINKNSPNGLLGTDRRFLMFNGAVGKEQMEWLDLVLQDATKLNQNAVICCHLPLNPLSSSDESLLWNYDEVMSLIHKYHCVKVCIAGHDHQGGHTIDSHGVHHRVLEAALECPPGTDAFGCIDLFHDCLIVRGTDRMDTQKMIFSTSMYNTL